MTTQAHLQAILMACLVLGLSYLSASAGAQESASFRAQAKESRLGPVPSTSSLESQNYLAGAIENIESLRYSNPGEAIARVRKTLDEAMNQAPQATILHLEGLLAELLIDVTPQQARALAETVRQESENSFYRPALISSLLTLAALDRTTGEADPQKLIRALERAETLAASLEEPNLILQAAVAKAHTFLFLSEPSRALESLQQAESTTNHRVHPGRRIEFLIARHAVLTALHFKVEERRSDLDEAHRLAEREGFSHIHAEIAAHQAGVLLELDRVDEALLLLDQLPTATEASLEFAGSRARRLRAYARVHSHSGKPTLATRELEEALGIYSRHGNLAGQVDSLSQLAEVYRRRDPQSTYQYLEQAYSLAEALGEPRRISELARRLAQHEQDRKRYDRALRYILKAEASEKLLASTTDTHRSGLGRTAPIRIAAGPDLKPFLFWEGSNARGLLADFWLLWSQKVNVRIEFTPFTSWSDAQAAVAGGEADLLAALQIDDADRAELALSPPFAKFSLHAAGRGASELRTAEDLVGHPVHVNTLSEVLFPQQVRETLGITLVPASTASEETLRLVPAGNTVAGSEHSNTLLRRLLLTATRKNDPTHLLPLVRSGFQAITTSELNSIEARWNLPLLESFFLPPRDRVALTPRQLRWLIEHPIVHLGAAEWNPLTVSNQGETQGIGIELVRSLLHRIGITPIFVLGDWNDVSALAFAGEIDGLGYAVASAERQEHLLFTDNFVHAPFVLVHKATLNLPNGLESLKESRVGVVTGYSLLSTIETKYPEMQFIHFATGEDLLRATAAGEVSAALEMGSAAKVLIRKLALPGLSIDDRTGLSDSMGLGLRPEWTELVELLDTLILSISETEVDEIHARWEDDRQLEQRGQQGLWLTVLAVAAFSLLLIAIGLVLEALKKRTELHRIRAEGETILRRAQRISRSGSWLLTTDAKRLTLSPESHRIFELPEGSRSMKWEDYSQLYEEASAKLLNESLERVKSGERVEGVLLRLRNKERFHRASIESINQRRLVGTLIDCTQEVKANQLRQRLEEEVEQLQRLEAMGRLAGGIAHDFNNILTANIACCELALLDLDSNHSAASSIEDALKAAFRARDLVSQMLTLSRRQAPETRPFSLNKMVAEALPLIRASLPATIDITTSIEETDRSVEGNASQIDQVLMNLCVNSGQAMVGGGQLVIAVEGLVNTDPFEVQTGTVAPGEWACISVQDSGEGIPELALQHVLEPFFTTKPIGEGSGMGLAMVHGLVKAHKGHLQIESRSGEGTKVTVYLPEVPQVFEVSEAKPETLPRGAGQTVMIIDDEEAVVSSLSAILVRLNYRPLCFTDPHLALEAFESTPSQFDLVLCDLTMPGLTGDQVIARIHGLRPDLPVIIATGYDRLDRLCEFSSPPASILHKPTTTSELASTLAEHLAKAHSQSSDIIN